MAVTEQDTCCLLFLFFLFADNIKFALTYLTYVRTYEACASLLPAIERKIPGQLITFYAPSYSITVRDKYFMRPILYTIAASVYNTPSRFVKSSGEFFLN